MQRFIRATLCALAALSATSVGAQTYPTRPVGVVVPYPAGGSVDGIARLVVQKLNESLGQYFIVDNRAGGAGGIVGASYVARAPADGTTLLLTASIHVVTPFLNKNVPYDVVKDFTPITLIARSPLLVSTSPSTPADNLRDFFAAVKADPRKYTFATSSFGSAGHLATELLKRNAEVEVPVMAYRGAAPALTDLASGSVQLMVDPMLSSLPMAQGKLIKALAITSAERFPNAPDIPTVAESGMPGFEFQSWYGLWAPKNLPDAVNLKLQAEVAKIMALPDIKRKLLDLGFEPIGSNREDLERTVAEEMARSSKIIADAKIKIE